MLHLNVAGTSALGVLVTLRVEVRVVVGIPDLLGEAVVGVVLQVHVEHCGTLEIDLIADGLGGAGAVVATLVVGELLFGLNDLATGETVFGLNVAVLADVQSRLFALFFTFSFFTRCSLSAVRCRLLVFSRCRCSRSRCRCSLSRCWCSRSRCRCSLSGNRLLSLFSESRCSMHTQSESGRSRYSSKRTPHNKLLKKLEKLLWSR